MIVILWKETNLLVKVGVWTNHNQSKFIETILSLGVNKQNSGVPITSRLFLIEMLKLEGGVTQTNLFQELYGYGIY